MNFESYVGVLISKLNGVLAALVTIAVIILVFLAFKLVLSGGNPEERAKLKAALLYGFISMIVIVSFWGIVNFFLNSFSLG